MNLRTPFVRADRTPLVLSIERLRSSPPGARSWWSAAADTLVMAAVWLALGFCVAVIAAGGVVFACAAMDGAP